MKFLIQSELLRFRNLAVVFAFLHLFFLAVLSISGDLFAAREGKLVVGAMVYSLAGLLFGLYQAGSWKARHSWTWLLHRPLSPRIIFLALASAAALVFVLVFALPLLVATFFLDHLSAQWVDARHYWMTPYLLGTIFSFYLIGICIMLSASRAAFLLLLIPFPFLILEVAPVWSFLLQLLTLAWLVSLAVSLFKPNLKTHLESPLAVPLLALPIQYVVFWPLAIGVLFLYSTIVAFEEHGWKSYALHTWNEYFAEGSFERTGYLNEEEVLAQGLRFLGSEKRRAIEAEPSSLQAVEVAPVYASHAARGQLMAHDGKIDLLDPRNDTLWVFSHDRMLLYGRDQRTFEPVGWLGPSGRARNPDSLVRFSQIPRVVDRRQLLTRQRIYELDPNEEKLRLRFELAEGESFATAFQDQGGFLSALSDRALYLFAPWNPSTPGTVTPWVRAPLPGEIRNLSRVIVAKLEEKFLLSFVFGELSARGLGEARQIIAQADPEDGYEILADRRLTAGSPAWSRHTGFLVSPAFQTLHDVALAGIDLRRILAHPPPKSVLAWALLLAFLSAGGTAWSARRRPLERASRWGWTAAAFFLGLPAFVSFFFLTPGHLK